MNKHLFGALLLAGLLAAACGDEVVVEGGGGHGQGGQGGDGNTIIPSSSDKLDLLLVVDNSRGMADKQAVLAQAVPELVRRLVNPLCLDGAGNPAAQQPSDPLSSCPQPGTTREMQPLLDIHIGVVSSSLGGHGSDTCTASTPDHATENDGAHLLSRSSSDPGAPSVATWNDKGFLVWDPTGETHVPPGEGDVDALIPRITQIVSGAGAVGCGYESQLEAWYRFLVDPNPHESIAIENNSAVLNGTDQVILEQRASFLRPDSLLAIVMLTDENDCSIREGGQFYFAAQVYQPGGNQPYHLPRPRAACATDPSSECCRSCGQAPGDGCDASADDCAGALTDQQDNINLRCWEQKRRFGIDFLYPLDRYVEALTMQEVYDRDGNVVQNPLFKDLNPNDDVTGLRNPTLVLLVGVVGVPWQDIARRDANGSPDLNGGLDSQGHPVGGFQSSQELQANGTWNVILGDPSCYTSDPGACRPTDAHMIEDWAFRPGLPGPGSADPVHGHERTIAQNDLQYACIFPLPTPYDCTITDYCLCDPGNDSPLCEDPIGSGNFTNTQHAAAAVPAIRPLSVLREIGDQGIVGSICPAQLSDPSARSYGYSPVVITVLERLRLSYGG